MNSASETQNSLRLMPHPKAGLCKVCEEHCITKVICFSLDGLVCDQCAVCLAEAEKAISQDGTQTNN